MSKQTVSRKPLGWLTFALGLIVVLLAASMPLLAQEEQPEAEQRCGAYIFIPFIVGPDGGASSPDVDIHFSLPNTMISPDHRGMGGGPMEVWVVQLGSGATVRWPGMHCDEVWLPSGSKFRVENDKILYNGQRLVDYLYTYELNAYGYFNFPQYVTVE